MRRTTLAALLAALAVGGWIALFERGEDGGEEGSPVFELDEEDVLRIEIERPGEPVVRLSREDDGFSVAEGDGPPVPADASAADLLLQNVASLRYDRELEGIPEGGLDDFGLDVPALAVRVFPGAGTTEGQAITVGFGEQTPTPGKRYLRSEDQVLVASSFLRDNFDRTAWDLRDKRLLRLETPAARRLRLGGGGAPVELAREDGEWRIVRPFRFAADPFEASQFASRLLDAQMAGVAFPAAEREDDPFGLESPRLTVELDVVFGPADEEAARTFVFGGESRSPPGVFARAGTDPLVFVADRRLYEALAEGRDTGLEGLRSLRLFRFAAFRAATLRITNPEGEFRFERREGEEGREWTLEAGDSAPVVVGTVAVEDLLYKLNSTDAGGVGEGGLPNEGAPWTFAVTEKASEEEDEALAEAARLRVSEGGEALALRAGDDRTLVVGASAWGEIARLFAVAREPAEEP